MQRQSKITNYLVKRKMESNNDNLDIQAVTKKSKLDDSENSDVNIRRSPRKHSNNDNDSSKHFTKSKSSPTKSEDSKTSPTKNKISQHNENQTDDCSDVLMSKSKDDDRDFDSDEKNQTVNSANLNEDIKELPSSLETDITNDTEDETLEDDAGIREDNHPTLTPHISRDEKETWKGISLDCFRSLIKQNNLVDTGDFKPNPQNVVFFQINTVREDAIPKCHPNQYSDKWDNNHVKLPCSNENNYFKGHKRGRKQFVRRWELITSALRSDIKSSVDLEEAILSYNNRFSNIWKFGILHELFTEENKELIEEYRDFVIPGIIQLAVNLPHIVTKPIPLLKQNTEKSLTFSQNQIASLLANAFLCTYPRRNTHGESAEYGSYPSVNFSSLFCATDSDRCRGKISCKKEKVKCILHYFRRVLKQRPSGTVTFSRRVLEEKVAWEKSSTKFDFELHVNSASTIEDEGSGMIEADFANCNIGGGVLGAGCVQEEIRFALCPEMIIARLFTERLLENETLLIEGAERFSKYAGYGSSFKWTGDFVEGIDNENSRDKFGRWKTTVVAIDALVFQGRYNCQFKVPMLTRELNKAYCGFSNVTCPKRFLPPAVATGNWGCGAFGGDHRLKALLQMMVCAEINKNLAYFTFGDTKLRDDIHEIHSILRGKGMTIGEIWGTILQFRESLNDIEKSSTNLFDFIKLMVNNEFSDVETLETIVDSASLTDG